MMTPTRQISRAAFTPFSASKREEKVLPQLCPTSPIQPSVAITQAPAIQADAYFFDIDGTLLVTRDLVHWNALHQAMLEVFGVDTTIEGLPYHGKTDVAILRAAVARYELSRLNPDACCLSCSDLLGGLQ